MSLSFLFATMEGVPLLWAVLSATVLAADAELIKPADTVCIGEGAEEMCSGNFESLMPVGHDPLAADQTCRLWCTTDECKTLSGNLTQECSACSKVAKCNPAASDFATFREPTKGNDIVCKSYCQNNECEGLTGNPHFECGGCAATFLCHPGADHFDGRVRAVPAAAVPVAAEPAVLVAPAKRTPADTVCIGEGAEEMCSGNFESLMPVGHDPLAADQTCRLWCTTDECKTLSGNLTQECSACSKVAKCNPAASDFATFREPTKGNDIVCKSYCQNNECEGLTGNPHFECGGCAATFLCHPGADHFDDWVPGRERNSKHEL